MKLTKLLLVLTFALPLLGGTGALQAAKVTIELLYGEGVKVVGAVNRWDSDGNHRRNPDQTAKIDAPYLDATATNSGAGQWVFNDLKPGKYDLLIMGERLRIEGFEFVPVKEFDPFFPPTATVEDEDARDFILDHIRKSQHYENKVEPLYAGGDKKAVRVLVMLIRDKPTSYTPGSGTMRHEIWQYSFHYGGWEKERRTKVLDRVLMQVSDLRQWTWVWEPKLGAVEVKDKPITIKYELPKGTDKRLKGLYPY